MVLVHVWGGQPGLGAGGDDAAALRLAAADAQRVRARRLGDDRDMLVSYATHSVVSDASTFNENT